MTLLLFIIGASIGSFLNVVIDRLSTGRSIAKGRSYCENCKKTLQFFDLVPLFSYMVLHGKCRYCKAKIPFRLFLVELLASVTLPFIYIYTSSSMSPLFVFVALSIVILSFIGIFFADVAYGIIPDPLVIISALFSIIYLFLIDKPILPNILVGFLTFLFFALLFISTKGRGMGLGDVKLSFVLGLLLGFPNILIALYLAFLTGAAVSIILVIWKKVSFSKGTIPFGPFLVFSTIVALFMGHDILLPLVLQFL